MAISGTSRPFAYNPSLSPISGTTEYDALVLGNVDVDYSSDYGGLKWWGGPRESETLGYIIGNSRPGGQPVPAGVFGTANVGFWRSKYHTDQSFLDLANYIANKNGHPPFNTTYDAEIWLESNGYYTSFNLPTPTPTVTQTPTPQVTSTPTNTQTPSVTPTNTQTLTPTNTQTPTPTPSVTATQTVTPTVTQTPTNTYTPSPSVTNTQTATPTNTPSVTPTNVVPIKVLILGDGGAPAIGGYLSNYLSTTGHPITYSAVTIGTTYTGSGNITKANYDVVLLWTNGGQTGSSTLSTALTSYVNGGGNLVSGVFLWNLYPSGYNFTGTTAFNVTNTQSNDGGNFTVNVASSITNGIGSTVGFTLTNGSPSLVAGSTLYASYSSNSAPLVAVRQVGSSTFVSLNVFPGGISDSTSPLTKIVGNSIVFAAGTPSPSPTPSITASQTTTTTPTPSITATQTVTPTPSITPTQTLTPTTTTTPTPTPTEPYFLLFEDSSIATAENNDNIEIDVI